MPEGEVSRADFALSQAFTAELTSLSATLSPLTSSIPQMMTLLRASNPTASRAPSFDSYGAPSPAQPNQQRSASSLGGQSLGEGSLGSDHSLGSTKGAAVVGEDSRRSSSQGRRSNGDRSKTLSPPQPTPRRSTPLAPTSTAPGSLSGTLASTAPANLGSKSSSRSSTSPPEPLDRTTNPNLSPPHGPSTQAHLYEPSPSPAAIFGPSFTMDVPPFGPFASAVGTSVGGGAGAAGISSSAPAMMFGGGKCTSATSSFGSGGSGRRNKRRILQEDEEEEKPVEFDFNRYVVEETPEGEQSSSKRGKRELPQDPSLDIFPPMDEGQQPLGGGEEGDLSGEDPDTQ